MVSEKLFSCIFHYKPMADKDAPRAGLVWTPGARLAGMRIYKEDHYTLLHTKYESSRLCGFGEELFYVFPIVNDPQDRAIF